MADNLVIVSPIEATIEIETTETTVEVTRTILAIDPDTDVIVQVSVEAQEPASITVEQIDSMVVVVGDQPIEVVQIGDQGPPGASGGHYEHTQVAPAMVWTINHNLGYHPNVQVRDNAGRMVLGDIDHPSLTTTVITFSAALPGIAYLS